MKAFYTFALAGLLMLSGAGVSGKIYAQTPKPQLGNAPDRSRTTMRLANEVRRQLVTLPYYGVFDWLEGQILPNDTVVLRGQVTTPSTKSDAERRVKKIESVAKVQNQIEVLPVSQFDDQIRRQVYRAIYKFDSPLFQYAIRAVPPIHIIVKGGHVTLKGVVLNNMDRQLAETYARQVPDVFDVVNQLKVENAKTE
jgi:hyperosmotically inducible protein